MTSLIKTNKFHIYDKNTITNSIIQSNNKKSTIQLSYNKRISLFELIDISNSYVVLSIDDNTLIKLDNELKVIDNDQYTENSTIDYESKKKSCYNINYCRTALYIKLISLLQGKIRISSDIAQFIVLLINEDIIPAFISDELAGKQLVDCLLGDGLVYYDNTIVSTKSVYDSKNIQPLKLSKPIVYALSSGQFLLTSVAALSTAVTSNIVTLLDPIAAISSEYIEVDISLFDSSIYETNRQHRGQIASANALKTLLDGSKRVSNNNILNIAFSSIPQSNGSIQDLLNQIIKTIDIEINSSEDFTAVAKPIVFQPYPAKLTLKSLTNILIQIIESSQSRLQSLNQSIEISYSLTNNDINNIELLTNISFNLLTNELTYTLNQLNELEKSSVATSKDKSTNEQSKNFKPVIDDSNLTPEQRLKAEAKRKLKQEKLQSKLKEKESKKSNLLLGVGTSQLRSYISSSLANDINTSNIQSLISPYNNEFSNYYTSLIDKLNAGGKRKPKIAKGTRDYGPEQMRIREQVFATIRRVFKRHGGVEIDTPVFELKEVLTGKYGEDSKLIYDLADQGGELLSLRYDLTVPFARFLAMNSVGNIKRYHIAKVYRRDQPQLARGRYREFYQCDFDVAGNYPPMVPDAEVITVAVEILSDLPVGSFIVKLNHRKLLDAIFELSGVPAEKFRPICSAVDKLDKLPWVDVKKEMIYEKGLSEEVADRIGLFVNRRGDPRELLDAFNDEKVFGDHVQANQALIDMKILFDYLEAMGSLSFISFDMSLARGLDYYTGVIYEIVLVDGTSQVGSISAGGRYDNLVGMFSVSGAQTPCVGVSIGIERVFAILEKKADELKLLQSSVIQVYIASIGPGLIAQRMRIANLLWKSNISAEYSHLENPKLVKQLDEVLERKIPFMIVFGEDELQQGVVKLKIISKHEEINISIDKLVESLQEQGCLQLSPGIDLSIINAMK